MLRKILLIVGTRPEAIKVIPVYLELKKLRDVDVRLVSTGQHREMLQQIFSFFEITPEIDLDLMKPNQSLSQLTSTLFDSVAQLFTRLKPDLIFVQGDTTTAMVSSMVAYYHQIKVAHIEAGLRTFNNYAPFPEEVNRKIISLVADYNFAPTQHAVINLQRENAKQVHMVGNTVVDAVLLAENKIKKNISSYDVRFKDILIPGKKIILITAHRRESFGDGLRNICQAIQNISTAHPEYQFIFPVHLNPNVQGEVKRILTNQVNVKLIDPLRYDELVYLLSKSYLVLTDSGGIQEEAPSFHVPVIILRDITERPEGIEAGCAILAGTKQREIETTFREVCDDDARYRKMTTTTNPYGDGMASPRIATIISHNSNL